MKNQQNPYETRQCYEWTDEHGSVVNQCFIDEGGLGRLVDGLPWGLQRGAIDVTTRQANNFIAGVLDGLRKRDDLEYIKYCISGSNAIANTISFIKQDLEKQSINEILNGVTKIKDIVQVLP